MKRSTEKGYNVNVLMSSKIRIDNAIGMFTADSKGKPLTVKKSGNGAVIPFLKRYTGKKAIVFVIK
jgi:hypothetical protein